jgi:hypothetical protein
MVSNKIPIYGCGRKDLTTFVNIITMPACAALLDGLMELMRPSQCAVYIRELDREKHLFVHHRIAPTETREFGTGLVKYHKINERLINTLDLERLRGLKLNIHRGWVCPDEESFTEDILHSVIGGTTTTTQTGRDKQEMIIVEMHLRLPKIEVEHNETDKLKDVFAAAFRRFTHLR